MADVETLVPTAVETFDSASSSGNTGGGSSGTTSSSSEARQDSKIPVMTKSQALEVLAAVKEKVATTEIGEGEGKFSSEAKRNSAVVDVDSIINQISGAPDEASLNILRGALAGMDQGTAALLEGYITDQYNRVVVPAQEAAKPKVAEAVEAMTTADAVVGKASEAAAARQGVDVPDVAAFTSQVAAGATPTGGQPVLGPATAAATRSTAGRSR